MKGSHKQNENGQVDWENHTSWKPWVAANTERQALSLTDSLKLGRKCIKEERKKPEMWVFFNILWGNLH